ncbi:unnamed protein product [Mycena citricolor]|uniref:Uncharacterized protein n=1 Tax=Mycena citricolor TaxID=2018698 RepID=A0AAD2H1B4_9AGAR|nr:unnamed protein product [Mycena citricolor]
MPLPLGLKVAWLALSGSGVISCWAVLIPLAWRMQSYWGPVGYALGVTVLEGAFILGMSRRGLDPQRSPVGVCLAQVLVIGFSTFFIAGILAALTTATTMHIAKPKRWGPGSDVNVLRWKSHYILPVLLFPVLASAVQSTLVLFSATFGEEDSLTCIPSPLWLRFVGYAGTPLLITLPCLWLTCLSAWRIWRTHRHISRSRRSIQFDNLDKYTVVPPRRRPSKHESKSGASRSTGTRPPTPRAVTFPSPPVSSTIRMTREPRRQPTSLAVREKRMKSFHLPFVPSSLGGGNSSRRTSSDALHSHPCDESFGTISSISFAEMKPAPAVTRGTSADVSPTPLRSIPLSESPLNNTERTPTSIRDNGDGRRSSIMEIARFVYHSEPRRQSSEAEAVSRDKSTPARSSRISQSDSDWQDVTSEIFSDATTSDLAASSPELGYHWQYHQPSKLSPLLRNIVIFQFAIIATHILSVITPLVDLSRTSPSEFGTQHVALVLAAWIPVVVFGFLPWIMDTQNHSL